MTRKKVVLIDDEPDARFILRELIEKYHHDFLEVVAEGDSVQSGIEILQHVNPDLIFLDIRMHDGSGFDLLAKIQPKNAELIFVTAYDEYALKAFQFSAFGYLIKPVRKSDLDKIVASFKERRVLPDQNEKRIKVLVENYGDECKIMKLVIANMEGFKVLEMMEIVRLEGDGNYTRFILTGNRKETSTKSLGVYEDILNEFGFFRAHQSTLINLRHVKGFFRSQDLIEMSDGEKIKLSRYRKSEFFERFV
jgi:two-component system, LytTR family, response regulator